jgi:hypothetical protein
VGVILAQLTISLGGCTLPSQNAFRVVLIIGAGAALAALAIASFIPTRRPAPAIESPTTAAAGAAVS